MKKLLYTNKLYVDWEKESYHPIVLKIVATQSVVDEEKLLEAILDYANRDDVIISRVIKESNERED